MNPGLSLCLFIIGVVGVGIAIGTVFTPGEWYAALEKPPFNPPNWIFAPVWTALYVLIGIVGWRVWRTAGDDGLRLMWVIQMALNFAWSPAFFGAQSPLLGLLIILPLLGAILAFIWRAKNIDPTSAIMFLPYSLWVAFASVLNGSILMLN